LNDETVAAPKIPKSGSAVSRRVTNSGNFQRGADSSALHMFPRLAKTIFYAGKWPMVTTLSAREKVADFFPGAQLPQMHHNINKKLINRRTLLRF
jgi:hypothetical protein